ncbi:MAG: T9SS C-terminal target domain-containing protein [Bacteroidetes bacterium]|nr:MAG: T9SS C-terminal target domain-containing protein [Bacteroidota bacterium]
MLRLRTVNCLLQTADCRLPTADCRLPTADCRLLTSPKRTSLIKLPQLFFIAALFAVNSVSAQWEPDVRLTNDPAGSWTSIYNAWCVAASSETVHVVWYDDRDGNTEIYYKRSTDAGLTWEQDTRLTNDDSTSIFPSIAVSGSLVLIAWDDDRDGTNEIYSKRSIDGGNSWEADTRLTYTAVNSQRPSIAISGLVVHVVWHDLRDGIWAIYYKQSDNGGVSWGDDTRLTYYSSFSVSPSIAVSGSVVHIAWRDYRDDNDEIYYKRSTDGGLNWGEETRLTNNSAAQDRPSISTSGSAVYIVWRDFRDGNHQIYYKRSPDGGLTWEADTRLTNSYDNAQSPSIAAFGSDVHVVWYDDRDINEEIFYKQSEDEGLTWGADTRLTFGDSQDPTIAVSGPVVHVVWTDKRDGNYEIYYKRKQNLTYQQKLYSTCKVWGFVKYYHSRVSNCEVNWDSVLVSTLPLIKNAVTNNDFNDALVSMLTAAGPMEIATTPSPDTLPPELKRNLNFGWINDAVFRNDVKTILDTIKNNFRPHPICWVHYNTYGWLSFPHDDPMIDSNAYINYPTEFSRLLILFKYWNILNYFNPYNYVQDIPWDSTLYKNVVSIDTVTDYTDFFKSVKKISAGCNDAHTEGLTWSSEYTIYGYYCPKIVLRYTQNKYVVVKSAYGIISKGDVIVSINNMTPVQWEDSLRPYISAGNPSVFRRFMCSYMLRGVYGSQIQIVSKDSVGNDHSFSSSRNYYLYDSWFTSYYPNDTLGNVKWKKWNCNIGYINMGKLMSEDVDTMYSILKNTTAIIFDIRNYPNATAWDIANLIYPDSRCFSKLTEPDIFYPGTYSWYYDYLGWDGNPSSYSGQVIILCNQETISQAEYSCMILGALSNSVIVGSQTSGTDGNVTYFKLSQDIQTGFTSLGVYYPNGDSTERIGIVPDSVVYPTFAGIRQGRDEVLEKALQVAGCLVPMLSVTPATQNVAATVGTTAFTVTSNTNWSAVSDASWCSVTSSGSGNGTIVADYTENPSYQSRIANIRVTVAGLPDKTVTVNQAKSTIGVEEYKKDIYQIYPNPTKGFFKIVSANGEKGPLDISIRDLTGKMMLEKHFTGEKEYEIDFSSASRGCYFIIIKTIDNIIVYKLIIN